MCHSCKPTTGHFNQFAMPTIQLQLSSDTQGKATAFDDIETSKTNFKFQLSVYNKRLQP